MSLTAEDKFSVDLVAILLLVLTLFVSLFITRAIRNDALRRNKVDVPNERSSHKWPTPRGGGLAIVVSFVVGLILLTLLQLVPVKVSVGLVGGGILVAAIGFLDDRGHISPLVRAVIHLIAAIWTLAWIGGMPALDLGFAVIQWGIIGHLVGVIGLVWLINLYNFMDGIDGIAASEAVFVTLFAGILITVRMQTPEISWLVWLLTAASLGFLYWNWQPARIFMGDVGSGFLGLILGALAIISAQHNAMPLWSWLILLGVFIIDATITLLRRMLRGQRWYQAHRSHAYQHLAIRWRSHIKVVSAMLGFNLTWLILCAVFVWQYPQFSVPLTGVALLPLLVLSIYLKSGIDPT
jgi:Fuc2NAc and GlcNAc transferase